MQTTTLTQTSLLDLRCVECGHDGLTQNGDETLSCPRCERTYLRHPYRRIPILLRTRTRLNLQEILNYRVVPQHVDLDHARAHWKTGGMADMLPPARGERLLNFGSGDGGDRQWLESQGYNVTTFDIYPGDFTDYICDGHELPFADHSFDVVTAISVFEHLYNPFRAAAEIYRVLKPGGLLIGSASFLEPFHANSYFHMSFLGQRELWNSVGFRTIQLSPGWPFTEALNGHYFLWNKIKPLHAITRRWQRATYRFGQQLWKVGYKLRGKPLPRDFNLFFCGSIIFRNIK